MIDTAENSHRKIPWMPLILGVAALLLIIGAIVFDINFLSFVNAQ